MRLLFRVLPLLFLLIAPARAEQALQLSSELGASATRGFAPPPTTFATPELPASVVPRLPDPSREVRDELPPMPTIDLTTPPDDLWQRMRNGFSMPDLDSPLVADRQAWYLNRPDLLKRIFERSRRYLHHIVEELEKRGMPTELALLPMVESSFNPLAYSSARMLGMWQFIPATGKTYKLQQNWWFDQRRDIVASTGAALDYLQTIYEMHGDWHLALASYNWGENAVARAMATRTRPRACRPTTAT
jgi:membrane-bound lytic murein transglycosylase D